MVLKFGIHKGKSVSQIFKEDPKFLENLLLSTSIDPDLKSEIEEYDFSEIKQKREERELRKRMFGSF